MIKIMEDSEFKKDGCLGYWIFRLASNGNNQIIDSLNEAESKAILDLLNELLEFRKKEAKE